MGQGGDVINILHKEMDAHVTAEGIYARFGVDEQVHLRRRSQKKVAQSIMASNSPTTFWQVRRLLLVFVCNCPSVRVCLYAIVQVSACVCMQLCMCPRVFVCCRPACLCRYLSMCRAVLRPYVECMCPCVRRYAQSSSMCVCMSACLCMC
jgi:hypothetical protein